MQPPSLVMDNTASSESNPQQQKMKKNKKTNRIPTAEELISHYESQGMDTKQASTRVINDLQKALFRVVTNSKNTQNQQEMGVNGGILRRLDMKIDTKPGYPQMLGIGVASAAVFRGIETLIFPQIASSFGNVWKAVTSVSNPDKNI